MHGISPDAYQQMLDGQGGVCAICKTDEPTAGKKSFCVDHDHKTGRVRGVLCTRCNTMIGNARDDIGVLTTAIAYLEASR